MTIKSDVSPLYWHANVDFVSTKLERNFGNGFKSDSALSHPVSRVASCTLRDDKNRRRDPSGSYQPRPIDREGERVGHRYTKLEDVRHETKAQSRYWGLSNADGGKKLTSNAGRPTNQSEFFGAARNCEGARVGLVKGLSLSALRYSLCEH